MFAKIKNILRHLVADQAIKGESVTGDAEEFVGEFVRAASESVGYHKMFLDQLCKELGSKPYDYFVLQTWEEDYRANGETIEQEGMTSDGW